MIGSHCIVRAKVERNRWKDPEIPEYKPYWMVMLRMPGGHRERRSSLAEICPRCLEVPPEQSPTAVRPNCRCLDEAKRFAMEWQRTAAVLWKERRLDDLRGLRLRQERALTIGEVIDTYLANMPQRMAATGRDNVNDLLALLHQAEAAEEGAARSMEVTVLTRELALTWMRMRQAYNADLAKPAALRRSWPELRAALRAGTLPALVTDVPMPGNATINTMLTKVKSIFGNKSQSYYLAGLELPNLSGFLSVSRLLAKHGHEEVSAGVLAALDREAAGWRSTEPELWIAYELLATTGMRPIEVLAARGSWLVYEEVPEKRDSPGWLLVVKNRPDEDFWLKARGKATVRFCPIADDLAEMLADRTGYLVAPELSKTARENLVRRDLSGRVRKFLPDRKGSLYELRKNFTSAVYTLHGKEAAADRSGHASSDVTEAFYATRKGAVPTVPRDRLMGGGRG